jgi:Mesyanzhinovviridae bifunctional DNA primase/polymerase
MAGKSNSHPEHAGPSFSKLRPHIRARHDLIKLHRWNEMRQSPDGPSPMGKRPFKGWRTSQPLSVQEAQKHMESGGNIGVRLRPTDLVIDIDPRHFPPARNPFAELCKALNISSENWPCVHTGGGGHHYYLAKADDLETRGKLDGYPGVEFKTAGTYVVAAGSMHPGTKALYEVGAAGRTGNPAGCLAATTVSSSGRRRDRPHARGPREGIERSGPY